MTLSDTLTPSEREDVSESRITRVNENNAIDEKYGFLRPKEGGEKIGYLINMHSVNLQLCNIFIRP